MTGGTRTTLACMEAAIAETRPRPFLRDLALRAVEAHEALSRACRADMTLPDEDTLDALDSALEDATDALMDHLAALGIDRALAARLGAIL